MGPGNGTLAVPGDRCRSIRGRLEDAFDAGSRMETGQHLSLAREFYWGRTAFARRPICQQMKRGERVNLLLREPNSIALGNSLDRDRQFLGGLRPCCNPVEVPNVLSGFLNNARGIRAARPLVPRDDGARFQRFDHVGRGDPLLS
jgi:hypothetical protein